MEQESKSAPRGLTTRRTNIFRFAFGLAVFQRKLLYAGCVTSAVGTHPCARQSSSHSIGWRRFHRNRPTKADGDGTPSLPMWRPARRLTTAGMSRNCVPFAKERQYYTLSRRWGQWDFIKKQDAVSLTFWAADRSFAQ